MSRTILVSTGTSLLTNEQNADALKGIYDKVKPFLSKFDRNFDEEKLVKNSHFQEIYNKLKEYFNKRQQLDNDTNPFRFISAEVNSLRAMDAENLLSKDDEIIFVLTETWEGYLCGKILEGYYLSRDFRCDSEVIPGLQVFSARQFKTEGIPNYAKSVGSKWLLNKEKLIINATGGFKALIPYAVLLGNIFTIDVVYIFEKSTELIIFPPLNFDWDFKKWENHIEILRKVNEQKCSLDEIKKTILEEDYIILLPLLNIHKEPIEFSELGMLFYDGLIGFKSTELLITQGKVIPITKAVAHPTIWDEKHRGKQNLMLSDLPSHIRPLFQKFMEVNVVKEIILGNFQGKCKCSMSPEIRLFPFTHRRKGRLTGKVLDARGDLNKYQNITIGIEEGYEQQVYDYFQGRVK